MLENLEFLVIDRKFLVILAELDIVLWDDGIVRRGGLS